LKLSMNPFCRGLPGAMQAVFAPPAAIQCESAGGPDADRRANPLIRLKPAESTFGADLPGL